MTYRRQECMGANTCSDIIIAFIKKISPPTTPHKPSIYQGFRKAIGGGNHNAVPGFI